MKLTSETIRRKFMELFEAMSPERQAGVIEALQLIHEHGLAQGKATKPAAPLFEPAPTQEPTA
jgi:hypothetical protein